MGYSRLIRRDFFNKDGPKRQPMALVVNESVPKVVTQNKRQSSIAEYIKRSTVKPQSVTKDGLSYDNDDLPLSKAELAVSRNVSVDMTTGQQA